MNQKIGTLLKIGANPFENAFIRTPWDQDFNDVPSINSQATDTLLKKLSEVHETGLPRGVLLLGEPGFGKSHILARLRNLDRTDMILAFVEPPPSPDRVLRHILRETVVRLSTSPNQEPSPLAQLSATFFLKLAREAVASRALNSADVARLVSKPDDRLPSPFEFHAALEPFFYDLQNQAIGADPDIDAGALRALFFLIHESMSLRVQGMRWLRGDLLADDDLARLGIPHTPLTQDPRGDENHARSTLRQILKICRTAGKVLVVCVDQIEEVNDGPATAGTGIRALAEALSNLIQYETSLLVVTACLRDRWEIFAGEYLNSSQCDRIAQPSITLQPLVYDQGVELIQSRLDAWEGSRRARVEAGRVFDLKALESWMKKEVVVHPRAVIQHCCSLLEEYRDGIQGLPLGKADSGILPIQECLRVEVEKADRLRRSGVKHISSTRSAGVTTDGPSLIEPPIQRPVRDRNEPILSLDPVGWYFGLFEQTIRDLKADPARTIKDVDEQDLAATLHELLTVLNHKGARLAGGRISSLRLGHYLKDRKYFGNSLELTVNRRDQEEQRGIVISSADHFQSIRALLDRILEAMQHKPGFLIRTIPLRNTYRKSREIMQKMPLGAAFIMEEKDYLPMVAAQKLRHAAAAGDLSMGPKIVTRDEVDSLLVRSGVLEDNRVIRTAFQNTPKLVKATVMK